LPLRPYGFTTPACGLSLEFCKKCFSWTTLPRQILFVAVADMCADLWVLEFEVVLEFIDIHYAGDWDTIFFEYDVFLVEMNLLDQGTEVIASLGNGETADHR
jgi:hypothetical protein